MAETLNIPDDMLAPGDLVAVEYEIVGANQTLVDMAIHDVKNTLSTDPRFDYQGSEIVDRVDLGTGTTHQYLICYVQVRKTLRAERPEQQEAGVLPYVALAALVGIAVAAVACHYLSYRKATVVNRTAEVQGEIVEKILNDPNMSSEDKSSAIRGLQQTQATGVGSGLAAAGSAIGMALVIIGVLWALSLSHRGGVD